MSAARARLHARADAAWRSPLAVVAGSEDHAGPDPRLLHHRTRGHFWETLARLRVTLLVTREYEHLVVALHANRTGPRVSYLPMPHPSGIAVDPARRIVHVASTRNPNQIYDLAAAIAAPPAVGARPAPLPHRPLVPIRTRFLPGGTYVHDLAMIGGRLHANAVGRNAVVRISDDGRATVVWWPRCVERRRGPILERNHLQLNSIAAGRSVRASYFSASTDVVSARRPGHRDFPVDGRGVIFSGATREPVVRGLTRPHSARLRDRTIWVDNSGYGEVGFCEEDHFVPVARPGGWTRGLAFHGDVAFVGTSRLLTRFRRYAPGLDPRRCACGVHALDVRSGRILGSLVWPYGNQVFAVEALPESWSRGLPCAVGRRRGSEDGLFYGFVAEYEGGHTR